jgi:uncharacterized protein with FMN-binding domain
MDRFARIAVAIVTMTLGTFVIGEPSWAADPVNVAGTWNITVESPNGTGTPTVVFKQEGETLTGTYKGRFGDSSVKGTIKGNDIKFSTIISPQGQDLEITYSGTVEGDTMKGTASFGAMSDGSFSGKKAAASAAAPSASSAPAAASAGPNVTGTWNFTIESPNGTATPSAVFKQDGENLTGTYKGRLGEVPLKGTVKGNQIVFSFKVSPQGQEIEIQYAGTVEANAMKGTVKFGEMGEAPFNGKKQE